MVAGVPMMNGCSILEGYVPEIDATVVQRILDAGGEIVGKVHCESYCISGGSHTGAKGPVHNPYKMGYAAGGSSAAVAWSWVRQTWRSVVTREGRFASPRAGVAFMA